MAWTLTTLTTAIEQYLQTTETSFVANIPTFITQCEDRISKSVIMPMNRKNAALVLTNGTPTVALPADFLSPFEYRIITTAGNYDACAYQDVSYMREVFPTPNYVGVPRYYSMFDNATLIMAPSPTAGLSGWLNYFYKPESITVAVSGTSWLGTNAENCLLYGCLSEAYTYVKGEADLQKLYEDKFMAALGDLRKLGEGADLGDAWRMGEVRVPR